MTNTTTAESRSNRVMRIAWITAIVVHGVAAAVFFLNEDLRTETLAFNREEAKEKAKIVSERARQREELEKERRERTELRKKDAENLRREEERKRRDEMAERVAEVKESYEVVKKVEEDRLRTLESQVLEQQQRRAGKNLRDLADRVLEEGEKLQQQADGREVADPIREAMSEFMATAGSTRGKADALVSNRDSSSLRETLLQNGRQLDRKIEEIGDQLAVMRPPAQPLGEAHAKTNNAVDEFLAEVERLFGENTAAYAREMAKTPVPVDDEAVMERARQLENQTADELYDTAVELEKKLGERYENARAAELAVIRETDFAEAKERLADLGETRRPDLGREMREKQIDSVGDLNEYRETLDRAVAETENIRARAQNRVSQVDPDGSTARASKEGTDPQKEGQQQARGRDIAAANLERRKTLLKAVRQRDGQSIDMTGMMQPSVESQSQGSGEIEGSSQVTGASRLPDVEFSEQMVVAKALPGRRFTDEAARQGWLYIDTWYVIGPWPLREYDEKPLPPQTEIDLDAVYYNGKQGSPRHARTKKRMELDGVLKWQFHQSDKLFVRPPFETGDAIYFAYTELYFDRARDVVVAIGVDDESNVWINGDLIWSHRLKAWNLGSSLRKVSFKQGYNTVLIRMDNGAPLMDFSLVFCPPVVLEQM